MQELQWQVTTQTKQIAELTAQVDRYKERSEEDARLLAEAQRKVLASWRLEVTCSIARCMSCKRAKAWKARQQLHRPRTGR